jgi:small-conductance mechanosensitive channel
MTAGLFGNAPVPPPNLPGPQEVIGYLDQTIDWHRHLASEEQLATDPVDVRFLDDDKQLASQVLRLSFDFARADAELLAAAGQTGAATTQAPESSRYQSLSRAAAAADADLRQTQSELESYRQKLPTARGRARTELQSRIEETQSEFDLARARSQTLHGILQFVSSGGTGGSLLAQIDQLQHTVPELETSRSKAPAAQANGAAPSSSSVQPASWRSQPSGILSLASRLFSLSAKMDALDRTLGLTDNLSKSCQSLRAPLIANVTAIAKEGDELAKQADIGDPQQLNQLKQLLDARTASFKQLSTVLLPLGRQSILFDAYKANVSHWRSTVDSEYKAEGRSLLIRLAALGIVIALILGLAELWRKATFRYIQDYRRRYQFLLLRRIVLWCTIGIAIAFGLATEIGSIATFAGLITAGLAVALQNVVLAVAGYFFLIGKYGVKIGDRVQIAGVTGDVVDIGLVRMHLMELGGTGTGPQPTGRVVAISNSTVFQAGASLFRQIPGTNFVWHEVSLMLAPEGDYRLAEQRMLGAVQAVYADYHDKIEQQHREMERSLTRQIEMPRPQSRLRLTQAGLEVVIRYPLDLADAAKIDDQITRKLLDALEQTPKLKLVGSGTPNIQPVTDGGGAAEHPVSS